MFCSVRHDKRTTFSTFSSFSPRIKSQSCVFINHALASSGPLRSDSFVSESTSCFLVGVCCPWFGNDMQRILGERMKLTGVTTRAERVNWVDFKMVMATNASHLIKFILTTIQVVNTFLKLKNKIYNFCFCKTYLKIVINGNIWLFISFMTGESLSSVI